MALAANIQTCREKESVSLERFAEVMAERLKDDETKFSETQTSEASLAGGYPALAQRYNDANFSQESVYGKKLNLYARKPCGKGYVCFIYTMTLEANEPAASAVMGMIYGSLKFGKK